MDDVKRALSQIADIQAQVAAASRFRGFAPEAMACNALLTLAVTLAQSAWPDALAHDGVRYVAVWGGALTAATVVSGSEAVSRSRGHGRMAKAMLGSILRLLLPFGAAGVVIAVAVCRFAPDSAWVIPGVWQILVALAGFAAAPSLPRAINWASAWYFVCGAVVLALAAGSGEVTPWMMGAPFAIGFAIVALILHQAHGERHDRA